MFNRTKRKIVFSIVASLLVLLLVTLATIYISNKIAIQNENLNLLKTYIERYSLNDKNNDPDKPNTTNNTPPNQPNPENGKINRNEPGFQLSTFYAVAYSNDGDILEINNGNGNLRSEDDILEITNSILKSNKPYGKTGNLTYMIEKRDNYTLVAMIDSTLNDNNQTMLIQQMLIIGSIALILLFVISIFIAKQIVKPLEENDNKQKRFISDAGHELKTPIAVISTNSELLRREIGNSDWLNNIDYENNRMSELVKQLLILSKTENNSFPMEVLDFSKLLQGELLAFESFAFEKGKQINSNVENGLYVKGNSNQLKQLLSILLDNSLSHGTSNDISLFLKHEKHNILLIVSNDASEINSEQLSHLFDRFYKMDESRTENNSHYGLGLSIAKAIVDSHNGTIDANYKDGKAIFSISLPSASTN